MNNKTTNILLGILIVVLIVIAVLIGINQNRTNYQNDMMRVSNSVVDNRNEIDNDQQVSTSSNSESINWNSVASSSVFDLYKSEKVSVGSEDKPTLLKEIDLTGDDTSEAIFSASTGNASSSVILMKNLNGSISVAKTKGKDGKIGNAELWEAGMAAYSMGYKLLPNEKGFYTISKSLDENISNDDYSHYICNKNDGLVAYQWNSKTNMFEWNAGLTAKYTAIECK